MQAKLLITITHSTLLRMTPDSCAEELFSSHDTPSRNRRYKSTLIFLTPFSGTRAIQIWERIRLVPDSDAD